MMRKRLALVLNLLTLGLALASCGDSNVSTALGGPQNHLHDILALRGSPHTVLLATHFALYRSTDGGYTWATVAGGSKQPMDGLMIYKLAQSPDDAQRVYVLAVPRPDNPGAAKAPAGIYASSDAGVTWKLATNVSALPAATVYTIGVGDSSANDVFAILPTLAEHGVLASHDAGATWQALPHIPDPRPQGITSVPAHAGRLALWSSVSGLYLSDDGGQSWRAANGIQGGVFALAVAGSTLYASGTNGLFVSRDAGDHFAHTSGNSIFASVVACDAAPLDAYALSGQTVELSHDGGQIWQSGGNLKSHATNIAADPTDGKTAYAASSYPLTVQATTDGGATWKQVAP
jgi:photosystem II stability/assembly factor-like uncharacterized protein